jgi:hypothetical protein
MDPFVEDERVIGHFGDNLLSRGFLPVLFVLENRSTMQAFLVEKQNFRLLHSAHPVTGVEQNNKMVPGEVREPSSEISREDAKRQGIALTFGSAVVALPSTMAALIAPLSGVMAAGIVGLPIVLLMGPAMEQAELNARVYARNLERKELLDRTLYPGESYSGFIYFPLKDGVAVENIQAAQVILKDIKTKHETLFTLRIKKGD